MCQAVRSSASDGEIDSLPQYVTGTTTWLSILHRFEHLLEFDVLLGGHSHIGHRNGDRTTVCCTSEWRLLLLHSSIKQLCHEFRVAL